MATALVACGGGPRSADWACNRRQPIEKPTHESTISNPQPAYCHVAAYRAFAEALPRIGEPEGLLSAAAAIALHAEPQRSVQEVIEGVERLTSTVRQRLRSTSPQAVIAHLHDVLFDIAGFQGVAPRDYYRPENSYLPRVLETKRGIPISLVLVYRSVAMPLGLQVEGVNAPGHFLAAVTSDEPTGRRTQYVDPYHSGVLLSRDEAIARIEQAVGRPLGPGIDPLPAASPEAWLRRMLLNLQAVFASDQQERDLLAMQELEALLPPAA